VAFDQSGPRWLGISDLIAEPEGPTFISYKVARSRLNRLRFVTQDPIRTLIARSDFDAELVDASAKSLPKGLAIRKKIFIQCPPTRDSLRRLR